MTHPPGNYWAQGDPPNTTRYWNGQNWEGPPVPQANQTPGMQVPVGYLTQAYPEDSQATIALVASLLGFIVCALGFPIGWALGKQEMTAIDEGRRDPRRRSDAKLAMYIGMGGTILFGIMLVGGVSFILILALFGSAA